MSGGPAPIRAVDSFTEAGARRLCDRINAYWAERGVAANARPEALRVTDRWHGIRSIWGIRSDVPAYLPGKARR